MTVTEWKDSVVEDKKLHLDVLKGTRILWVDTGSLEAKFQQLFKKVEDNRDLGEAKKLKAELRSMIEFYGLPESLDVHKRLADMRFSQFEEAENIWNTRISDIESDLEASIERLDVYKALSTIEAIQSISIDSIFGKRNIDVSQDYTEQLRELHDQADRIINAGFDSWLTRNVYCKSVDAMKSFERFYTRCRDLLYEYGYRELAAKLTLKGERELSNKAEIKSRQELVQDGKKFLQDGTHVAQTNYIEIRELIKRADDLEPRFAKYGEEMGKEALALSAKVTELTEKLKNRKKKMDEDMSSVFDIVSDAETLDGLELAVECLETVLGYTIPERDREEYKELQVLLSSLTEDCTKIKKMSNDRRGFDRVVYEMQAKYSSEEFEYDFIAIINDTITIAKASMDEQDRTWREENVNLGDRSRQAIYTWKQRIQGLPAYLSDETLRAVKELDIEADQLISDGKIEDVVYYFDRLDYSEKGKCLDILSENYGKSKSR